MFAVGLSYIAFIMLRYVPSFPMSQLFAWGGQSTGVSALASFLPRNTRLISFRMDWLDLLAVQGTGEGDDRGWDGRMASLTRCTWVSVNSGSWCWTGRPGVLWFMGPQRVGHDWVTDLIWQCALVHIKIVELSLPLLEMQVVFSQIFTVGIRLNSYM